MVAMTMLKIGASMMGRTTTRSSTTPMKPGQHDGRDQHQAVREPEPDQQRVAHEAARHHELALREVHDVGRLEDQDEPEGDERVHAAGGESAHDLAGQDLGHRYFRPISLSSVHSLTFTHLPSFTTTRRPALLMPRRLSPP